MGSYNCFSASLVHVFLQSDAAATIYFAVHLSSYYPRVAFTFLESRRYQQRLDNWVRRWWLLDAVSSAHSLLVLLSAMEMTQTTWIALVLAWWTIIRKYSHTCVRFAYTSHGYYLRAAFFRSEVSDCTATIRGRWLLVKHLLALLMTWNRTLQPDN